ncbi:MAG: hypothetical protein ACXV7G_11440 [Halobacteriota archaeon]
MYGKYDAQQIIFYLPAFFCGSFFCANLGPFQFQSPRRCITAGTT